MKLLSLIRKTDGLTFDKIFKLLGERG